MIDWTNLFSLLFLFSVFAVIIVMCLKIKKFFSKGWFPLDISFLIIVLWCFIYHLCIVYCWHFFRVNWIRVRWSWNLSSGLSQIVCSPYPNLTYVFASPAGLWKVVERVLVGYLDLSASIYWFVWSKISFELFIWAFFFLLLTCVYFIFWISAHCSWNLSPGLL